MSNFIFRMNYSGIAFILVLVIIGCAENSSPEKKHSEIKDDMAGVVPTDQLQDTVVFIENGTDNVKVIFKSRSIQSEANRGTILLLPGWNYSVEEWCTKTSFCEKAIAKGYNLILPEMEKSVYASQIYPETRGDLKQYVTRAWLLDTMIPYFQKEFGLLKSGDNNFVTGISTGGRGAALICLDRPEIFTKGVALSGDFNQAEMPDDNLMILFYGQYSSFKERWTGTDNVYFNINKFNVPFYIGHGKLDKVVPLSQSVNFYRGLKRVHQNLDIRLHVDSTAAHDYNYWGSEVDNILDFFEETGK